MSGLLNARGRAPAPEGAEPPELTIRRGRGDSDAELYAMLLGYWREECARVRKSQAELAEASNAQRNWEAVALTLRDTNIKLEAQIAALRGAVFPVSPHHCDADMVFVRGVADPSWFGVVKKSVAVPDRVISCSRCERPAVQLDHLHPYEERDTLCEEHRIAAREERVQECRQRDTDARVGRYIRTLFPKALEHECEEDLPDWVSLMMDVTGYQAAYGVGECAFWTSLVSCEGSDVVQTPLGSLERLQQALGLEDEDE